MIIVQVFDGGNESGIWREIYRRTDVNAYKSCQTRARNLSSEYPGSVFRVASLDERTRRLDMEEVSYVDGEKVALNRTNELIDYIQRDEQHQPWVLETWAEGKYTFVENAGSLASLNALLYGLRASKVIYYRASRGSEQPLYFAGATQVSSEEWHHRVGGTVKPKIPVIVPAGANLKYLQPDLVNRDGLSHVLQTVIGMRGDINKLLEVGNITDTQRAALQDASTMMGVWASQVAEGMRDPNQLRSMESVTPAPRIQNQFLDYMKSRQD